jgi:hypothetical protein
MKNQKNGYSLIRLNTEWTLSNQVEFFAYTMEWFNFHKKQNDLVETRLQDWPGTDYYVHISTLTGVELLIDNVPASMFKRAAVGTLVFGAIGTLAGLVSGATAKPKTKVHVVLQIDDMNIASFTFKCNNIGIAYRVINTLALMEKEYYKKNPNELKTIEKIDHQNENISHNNSPSEEIMKLKKMLDEGVIDQDEFKEMKSVLISKLKN